MQGAWRTVYGSDHHLGEHGDASAELLHGCSATSFIIDPKNSTRLNMVTGRMSGFKDYLCLAPPGPAEHGLDGCRRYLYDDSKLLVFNNGNRMKLHAGAVLDAHAADPDAPWESAYAKTALLAKEWEYYIPSDEEAEKMT